MVPQNSKCLLLNADYSLLGIISWQKAVVWSFKYGENNSHIEILAYFENQFINGASNKRYPVPAVARTIRYFNLYNKKINFSRHNLFIRDNYTCQYCGTKLEINQLTYDHVIPKSTWLNKTVSPTNWTNIVTACLQCNAKKGNKTPDQANMKLLKHPIQPKFSSAYLPCYKELASITISSCNHSEWEPFIGTINNYESKY